MRLGNAYSVLGETDGARNAYGRARDLADDLPQGDPRKVAIDRALLELGG
jgi:cytochrome c-type biogenesis protein CcmH